MNDFGLMEYGVLILLAFLTMFLLSLAILTIRFIFWKKKFTFLDVISAPMEMVGMIFGSLIAKMF